MTEAAMSAGLAVLAAAAQHGTQLSLNLTLVINRLPLWFLVFALFLPRIAMLVAWLQGGVAHFHLQGIIPLLFWAFLPRVLVLFLIYVDQGLSLWFVIHLVVALLVWGGSGGYHARRRQRDY
jgi:hypothetical protein